MSEGERPATARRYYDALDSHDYDRLHSLLAPDFTQIRPELTLDGRERFVQFMREERPASDTTHPIEQIYGPRDGGELAVRGRVVAASGETIAGFVDVFSFDSGRITRIRTYTD